MTKNGVQLDLFIEEIEPLSNDGTELIFECQNNFIQLSPKQIPLVNVLKK
jgi:hypothetical protein